MCIQAASEEQLIFTCWLGYSQKIPTSVWGPSEDIIKMFFELGVVQSENRDDYIQTFDAFLQDSIVHPNVFWILIHIGTTLLHNALFVHVFEHKFHQVTAIWIAGLRAGWKLVAVLGGFIPAFVRYFEFENQ